MKRFAGILVLLSLCVAAYSQLRFPSYFSHDFQHASPGALKFGLYGYDNPALLSYLHQPDLFFTWSNPTGTWKDFNRWGAFFGVPNAGIGVIHQKLPDGYVKDYRLSFAGGNKSMSIGLGYGWSAGETRLVNRTNSLTLGLLARPNDYVSLGFTNTVSIRRGGGAERVVDVAVRPMRSEILTLFADFALESRQALKDGNWSAGAVAEVFPGVRLSARYFDTKAFTVGFQFSFGNSAVVTQAHYDAAGKYAYNSYGIRLGAYDRTVLRSSLRKQSSYVQLNMLGPLKYQRFALFDNSKTLLDLISAIDAAKHDPAVSGIAINTSGMNANREMLWEVREKLKDFKASGKRVVMFLDRPGMDAYHFASVADRIVMDPQGMIQLSGYVMGRTFLKGTLEMVGVGYDEWRFFEYKSAYENFSRDHMSDADREQRQKLLDDYYRLAKNDICESRGFSGDQFETVVNEEVVYLANEALAKGLVDTLGRWETVKEVVKQLEGKERRAMSTSALERLNLPSDNRWGERPRIALVYALGACAMDEGITARKLVNDVQAAVKDRSVKAIVLRVDSPGGDGMASDYIAEALKQAKGKKPVIVSQGAVAASGGYWLSMYADTIVAAPNTITGSIGVIGGWIYNKGIKESLGLTTDHVKVGDHADLGFGFVLPFIGAGIPDRNLSELERTRMESIIRAHYADFVQKVADGRERSFDEIAPIAQGRVWSGFDGLANGLVDVLGGLETAINIAKERAGLAGQDVTIVELPKPRLFDPGMFVPKLFGFEVPKQDPLVEHLKFRLKNNGVPMPILPIEDIDFTMLRY
jgi:protease-4